MSKVLFYNITQRFTNSLVQLSTFLIYLFVGTYRLSSHARPEAFAIQTNLKAPPFMLMPWPKMRCDRMMKRYLHAVRCLTCEAIGWIILFLTTPGWQTTRFHTSLAPPGYWAKQASPHQLSTNRQVPHNVAATHIAWQPCKTRYLYRREDF